MAAYALTEWPVSPSPHNNNRTKHHQKCECLLTSGEDISHGLRLVRNDEMRIVWVVMLEVSHVDDRCFLIISPSTTIR
jgi:hypothetical protein